MNGSPTKTAMVDRPAAGRSSRSSSPRSSSRSCCCSSPARCRTCPNAVLAAVVFLIAVALVDADGMRDDPAPAPVEFWVALVTAATVVFVGVQQGIILAMALSIVVHLRHSYRPSAVCSPHDGSGEWRPHRSRRRAGRAGVSSTASAPTSTTRTRGASREVLTASGRERSAAAADRARGRLDRGHRLQRLGRARGGPRGARGAGVTLELCGLQDRVRGQLRRDGLLDAIGPEHVFETVDDALAGHGG